VVHETNLSFFSNNLRGKRQLTALWFLQEVRGLMKRKIFLTQLAHKKKGKSYNKYLNACIEAVKQESQEKKSSRAGKPKARAKKNG
jgi:uncharacterized lipoprotein YmbA